LAGNGVAKSTTPKAISQSIKDEEALKLKLAGLTYKDIAARMGYMSPGAAANAVNRALSKHPDEEEVAKLRRMQYMKLEQMVAALHNRAMRGDLNAVDRILKVFDMENKLFGAYQLPTQAHTISGEVTEHHDYTGLSDEERFERIRELFNIAQQRAVDGGGTRNLIEASATIIPVQV
jgi:transcriptional regulator with XRE-family HTH domain